MTKLLKLCFLLFSLFTAKNYKVLIDNCAENLINNPNQLQHCIKDCFDKHSAWSYKIVYCADDCLHFNCLGQKEL